MNTNTNNFNSSLLLASYTPGQIEFIKFLQSNRKSLTVTDTCTVSRKDLVELLKNSPYIAVPAWVAVERTRRAGRGHYLIPEIAVDVTTLTVNTNTRGRKPGSRNQKGRIDPNLTHLSQTEKTILSGLLNDPEFCKQVIPFLQEPEGRIDPNAPTAPQSAPALATNNA